jgi:hypothetical protein
MYPKTFSIKGFLTLCLFAGLISLLLASVCIAREPIRTVNGTVTKVSDGDTIHVTTPEKTKLTVRLYGIDAPETPKINQHTGHINQPDCSLLMISIRRQCYYLIFSSTSDKIFDAERLNAFAS